MARHNDVGIIGEDIATNWILSKGLVIVDRNYLKKWGEIDIVARETQGKVHFVEVKSVSYETKVKLKAAVAHGTFRPEENVHGDKQKRLRRTIETWLAEKCFTGAWQIDIVTVRMVPLEKYAQVKMIENVIFE